MTDDSTVRPPRLAMRGIGKRYPGVTALEGVDLTVDAGEVLALVGANGAGKSTLVSILGGVVPPDTGSIALDGDVVTISGSRVAIDLGIAFVQQEIATLPTLTVTENLFIAGFPRRFGRIDRRAARQRATDVLKRLGCRFSPDDPVSELSTGDRQMVEIARVLLRSPRVVIFDEPTASLSSREKAHLFDVVAALRADGVAVIYISHFLDEVFANCDRALVLRNGAAVGEGGLAELDPDTVVGWMIGERARGEVPAVSRAEPGAVVLEGRGMSRHGQFDDVDLTLRRGEVVGLWGLLGSGRTEVARALSGLDRLDGGQLRIDRGEGLESLSVRELRRHVGMVTEDRRDEGLLLPMSVRENISLSSLGGLSSSGVVNRKAERALVDRFIDRLAIKVADREQTVRTLSGGNQQKVVVARWLAVGPPIYVLDEPTRGLDVGAKEEIRTIVAELAEDGAAILVISSEMEELRAMVDRFVVLDRGRVVAGMDREATDGDLMRAAAGLSEGRTA